MSNVDRVLSLVIKIKDPQESLWMWKSLKDFSQINGVQVVAIQDGDAIETLDTYIDKFGHFEDEE